MMACLLQVLSIILIFRVNGQLLFKHDGIVFSKSKINTAGNGILVTKPIKNGEIIMISKSIYSVPNIFPGEMFQCLESIGQINSDGKVNEGVFTKYQQYLDKYHDTCRVKTVIKAYDDLSDEIKQEFDETLTLDDHALDTMKEWIKTDTYLASSLLDNELLNKYARVYGKHDKYVTHEDTKDYMYLGAVNMNHNYPTNVLWLYYGDSVAIIALTDLDDGDELYHDYYSIMDFAIQYQKNPDKAMADLHFALTHHHMQDKFPEYFQIIQELSDKYAAMINDRTEESYNALLEYLTDNINGSGISNVILREMVNFKTKDDKVLSIDFNANKYLAVLTGKCVEPESYMGDQFIEYIST